MLLKRLVPFLICFISGVFFVGLGFVPEGNPTKAKTVADVNDWFIIIGGFSIIIAVVSIFRVHVYAITRGYPGWFYSFVLVFSLVVTTIIGFLTYDKELVPVEEGKITIIDYIYDFVIQPLDATVFALLGFYIASAAYTGFRVKNFGSVLLLLSALIVMTGLIPIGVYLYDKVPDIALWVLSTPNNAAKRALIFTIAIASVAFSLKVLFGIDKSIYGGTKD
ncbi:MAG: hypothetical protein ACK4NF_01645 [Planctomycetota bacterium]